MSTLKTLSARLTVGPISDEKADRWQTKSIVVTDNRLRYAEFFNRDFGTLYFGEFSDGHVGWRWAENAGGGPVTLVFAIEPGKDFLEGLWFGLLIEDRQNLAEGGPSLCITGGFANPDEAPEAAHRREFKEETGGEAVRDQPLVGVPFVFNRNYSIADFSKDEGSHAFAVEVPWSDLIVAADATREHGTWKPKKRRLCFMPWYMMAQQTPDALAGLPMVRLLGALYEARRDKASKAPDKLEGDDAIGEALDRR